MSKWEVVKLGDIGDFKSGGTPSRSKSEYFDGNIPWITTVSLGKTLIDERDAVEHISAEAVVNSASKIILKNSIMVGIRVGVGKVSINTVPMGTNQDIISIVNIDEQKICKQYVVQCIRSYKQFFDAQKRGATIQGINSGVLKSINIPLPPLETQKRIAKTLDTATELLAMRKQQLAELDNLIKSTFYNTIGDPVANEKGWDKKVWGEVFNTTTGKLDANAMCEDGVYPFFTCSKEVYRINNFAFDCEALLLAGNNATANYDVKYYNGKFNAYQRTYVITLKDLNSEYFLFQYLLEEKLKLMKSSSKGTNTKYLTMGILGRMDFIVPPIELQTQFATIVTKIEEQKALVKKAIDETQLLFDSLMSEYFE